MVLDQKIVTLRAVPMKLYVDEMQNLRIFTFYPVKILVLQWTVNILYELESKFDRKNDISKQFYCQYMDS